MTGANYRNLIGNGIQLGWATGYIIIPLMAYYVPDYKNLQLISVLPEVVLFAWFNAIPESPRWLLTRGKKQEVIKTLRNAATINKMPLEMIEEKVDLAHNKIKQVRLLTLFVLISIKSNFDFIFNFVRNLCEKSCHYLVCFELQI